MRQKRREASGAEFNSNIGAIRAVEDSIRATKKYTEGIRTLRTKHPIQGTDSPSKVFCKYYEVYPDIELSWDMPAGVALDWIWGDVPCIDVLFKYDYRENTASVEIKGGPKVVKKLEATIHGFGFALAQILTEGKNAVVGEIV